MLNVTILQPDQFVLSTNLFFKINVLLPLVTGELLQNTVDVTSVTYKLYNIKIERQPVLQTLKIICQQGNHVIMKTLLHHRYRSGQVKSVVR